MGAVIVCADRESSVDVGEGAGLDDGCCVDWRFFLSWSRWPLAVASDGVMSDSLIKSMPGQERRKPFLMALRKVETAGLPKAACR